MSDSDDEEKSESSDSDEDDETSGSTDSDDDEVSHVFMETRVNADCDHGVHHQSSTETISCFILKAHFYINNNDT